MSNDECLNKSEIQNPNSPTSFFDPPSSIFHTPSPFHPGPARLRKLNVAVLKVIKGSCPGAVGGTARGTDGDGPASVVPDRARQRRRQPQPRADPGKPRNVLPRRPAEPQRHAAERQENFRAAPKSKTRTRSASAKSCCASIEGLPPDSDDDVDRGDDCPPCCGALQPGSDRQYHLGHRSGGAGRSPAPSPDKSLDELSSDSSSIITSLDVTNRGPRITVRPEAKLRAVMEISQNLARALKTEEVLPKILESLFKIFPAGRPRFHRPQRPLSGDRCRCSRCGCGARTRPTRRG